MTPTVLIKPDLCSRSLNLTVVGRREILKIQQLKEKVTTMSARINTLNGNFSCLGMMVKCRKQEKQAKTRKLEFSRPLIFGYRLDHIVA